MDCPQCRARYTRTAFAECDMTIIQLAQLNTLEPPPGCEPLGDQDDPKTARATAQIKDPFNETPGLQCPSCGHRWRTNEPAPAPN